MATRRSRLRKRERKRVVADAIASLTPRPRTTELLAAKGPLFQAFAEILENK
jgi:hypothetical protein